MSPTTRDALDVAVATLAAKAADTAYTAQDALAYAQAALALAQALGTAV